MVIVRAPHSMVARCVTPIARSMINAEAGGEPEAGAERQPGGEERHCGAFTDFTSITTIPPLMLQALPPPHLITHPHPTHPQSPGNLHLTSYPPHTQSKHTHDDRASSPHYDRTIQCVTLIARSRYTPSPPSLLRLTLPYTTERRARG